MTSILIVGGAGIVGSHLAAELAKKHKVHIVDRAEYGVDDDTEHRLDGIDMHIADVTSGGVLPRLCSKLNVKTIVHLAEDAHIDPSFYADAAQNNISATMQVLDVCAKFNVHGILGEWYPLNQSNLMTWSLNARRDMIQFYNKGNCVVTQAFIPFVLHPEFPSCHFGNIIGRIWDSIEMGTSFVIDDMGEEISLDSQHTRVSSISDVVTELASMVGHRTRSPRSIKGYNTNLTLLIGMALDAFDQDQITLYGKGDPRDFKRITGLGDHEIIQWIKRWAKTN